MSGTNTSNKVAKTEFDSGWTVEALVDDDGHLNIWVKHADGTTIHDTDADLGDGVDGEDLGFRFTTSGIEDAYRNES